MKKILLFVLVTLTTLKTQAQVSPEYSARLKSVFDSVCTKLNIKGASAAVYVPGSGVWKSAIGLLKPGIPLQTDMVLGIGSNTKTYIATAMLLLQEKGLLSLDDKIGQWITHPNVDGQITIRQMLNHTSGIFSYTDHPDFTDSMSEDFNRIWKPEEIYPLIDAPYFAAGTRHEYSNSNYVLAGMIIEKVTGKTYVQIVRDYILQPQGLNKTFFYPFEGTSSTIADPWSARFTGKVENMLDNGYALNSMFSFAGAAGCIMATAEENVLFWHALMSGKILNTESMRQLLDCVKVSSNYYYGLGIMGITYGLGNKMLYSHGGTNFGYINDNIIDKETGVCISVLTNQDSIGNDDILNKIVMALYKVTISPTAISQVKTDNTTVKIYPNPANDYINIEHDKNVTGIELYDMMGRNVLSQTVSNTKASISTRELSEGMYILKMQRDASAPITKQIQIKH
jgi:D-alanyl-D-alanine carboxypeptidase